ncbi:HAD-IC family P-type ATPase [Patescibacteria group bacterium]|nr:HAD-IC family P-type ATPase [Patescibacteria group bacterium]
MNTQENASVANSWYKKTANEIFEMLDSNEYGLTKIEAEKRIEKYGFNKLPEEKVESLTIIFLRQFQSPLIYILLTAALIVLAMGETIDSAIIFAVLFFNAVMGTIQEGKARNTLLALKKFTETSVLVLRDSKEVIIKSAQLVPGDIVFLQEGEKIPADARILTSNTLKINEASLTGESDPVLKNSVILEKENPSIVDQKNMLFSGTQVESGNGKAIIVAIGLNTEFGKIAQKITDINTDLPMKKNIQYLSRLIIVAVFFISMLIIFFGVSTGSSLKEMFMVAVAISVSIIPEGLPIVMTLVLAMGVRRMSKQNVLVKKLQAVEALGQTQVIAVDKTGTLTKNELIVQKIYTDKKYFEINGIGYEPKGEIVYDNKVVDHLNHPELILSGKIAAFCSNARLSLSEETNTWNVSGDPTEAAMLVLSKKIGFHKNVLERESPLVLELPFNYSHKYHAVTRNVEGKNFLCVVGAPEKILSMCKKIWHKGLSEKLLAHEKKELDKIFFDLAKQGFRVVAYAINNNAGHLLNPDSMPPLTFVGFFAIKDALRPEVIPAMEKVRSAGIRVVMITGDHPLTAETIAHEADIFRKGDILLTGEDIDKMDDKTLLKKLVSTSVFARVTPAHKLRIIQAYRKRGEIVAMTGDGVNDAPSLVAADLGVAMGKIGTEVAKEASDIILLDDNFGSIVSAAEEGRNIYKTIRKVTLYLLSTSLGEVFLIISTIILGLGLPILPAQIIWLNFVTDGFLDVSLAMEPKEKNLLKVKFKRPNKYLVDGLMFERMLFMAIPMAVGTLFLFMEYFETDLAKAWTISLTTLAVFQWFNAWNCRSDDKSIFQMSPFSNKYLVGTTIIVILLQLAAIYTPFMQKILNTVPLEMSDWLKIITVAFSIVVVEEIRKFFRRRMKTDSNI